MRNWQEYWRGVQAQTPRNIDEALQQIHRTVMGRPVEHYHLDTIVNAVFGALNLKSEDVVADLGCGNGLVTVRIATQVRRIAGIDVSEPLIEAARTVHTHPNCTYHVGDIAKLDSLPIDGVTKAYSYEVLQHLSTEDTRALLGALTEGFGSGLVFFVGGIPERARLRAFYDTPERWAYYERRMDEDTEQIGHWWERDQLVALCDEFGLACTPRDQAASLYSSHYRFDAKISLQ